MVRRLSPNPVVLLTVSEFTPSRGDVNQVILEMAQKYSNVLIVDWASTTADDNTLTGGDNLHLTNVGRQVLAQNVALALGQAPTQPGKCLASTFTDDSSGPVVGTTTTTVRRHTSTTVAHSTPTTAEPTTQTPSSG
jgi:hypothetical protein